MSLVATHPVAGRSGTSLNWFARHEARLIWRDFSSMLTAGRPHRIAGVIGVIAVLVAGLHALANFLLAPYLTSGIGADKTTLLMVSGTLVMFFSLMFSQAIESVTRAYYARSDLDLILSSPAPSHRLFQVRTSVLTFQTIALSLLIASPVINVLIWRDGFHWLAAYGVLIGLGGIATAGAVLMTLFLFRTVGAARTRLIAQIVAAVVGAGFVIALQAVAIFLGQGLSRMSLFSSQSAAEAAPATKSVVWLPAQATMGDPLSLLVVMIVCAIILMTVVNYSARRFARDVLATAGVSEHQNKTQEFAGFRRGQSVQANLRRKEWKLLARDPWLISQSLQQVLYLIPPALLLWVNYGEGNGIFYVVVPVIVMAAGQLAGGLAWLTISGEDAHELIETAPVSPKAILWAKVQAVMAVVAVAVSPFVVGLGIFSGRAAFFLVLGTALAAGSAILIQIWFRSQANRSLFRRRQVSSKAATISEALVSILWAAGAGLAIIHAALIAIPSVFVGIVMAIAWFVRPRRAE